MHDCELVERHVERIVIKPQAIEVRLISSTEMAGQAENHEIGKIGQPANDLQSTTINIPWAAPSFVAAKGILHTPSSQPTLKPETRDALLTAIAKARSWIDDLVAGRAASFAAIAKREGKVERHVRNLAQLAFLSPQIAVAIIDGSAPHDLTVTELAKALPYSWVEQERRIGLVSSRV